MKLAMAALILAMAALQDAPKQDPPKQDEPKKEDPKQDGKQPDPPKVAPIVAKLNETRKVYGVGPVEEDAALSAACAKHADYLSRNNFDGTREDPHDENKKKSAYSEEGKKAAAQSVLAWDGGPEKAIEHWLGSFINRVQILDPAVKKIGYGQAGKICVLDVNSARVEGEFEPVVVPHDKEDKVAVRFGYGGDDPDPLPRNVRYGEVGYPITVIFPSGSKVRGVSWSLKDPQNRRVECYTSTPEATLVKHSRAVGHAVALIPKGRLAGNTTYTVWVKCRAGDKPFEKTWSFTTK
jgi:hypothetical protein